MKFCWYTGLWFRATQERSADYAWILPTGPAPGLGFNNCMAVMIISEELVEEGHISDPRSPGAQELD